MKLKALITGITGQDGSYLAELLLKKGYEVHGIVRRVALENPTHRLWRIKNILKKIHLHSGSMESYANIFKICNKVKPHEFYHLAAQSYVDYSFQDEFSTISSNISSAHYCLSAIKEIGLNTKFYFAASSEMFGKARDVPQNERDGRGTQAGGARAAKAGEERARASSSRKSRNGEGPNYQTAEPIPPRLHDMFERTTIQQMLWFLAGSDSPAPMRNVHARTGAAPEQPRKR